MDCLSSVHGILQARILKWVVMPPLQGIFPTQGLNPGVLSLLHWQAGSLPLVPPGKSFAMYYVPYKCLMNSYWMNERRVSKGLKLSNLLKVTHLVRACGDAEHSDFKPYAFLKILHSFSCIITYLSPLTLISLLHWICPCQSHQLFQMSQTSGIYLFLIYLHLTLKSVFSFLKFPFPVSKVWCLWSST